jgi:hypothetical protein
MSNERVKVEKEFAVFVRGHYGHSDKEVTRVKAYSSDHAVFLCKSQGFQNVSNAVNIESNLYKRHHQA